MEELSLRDLIEILLRQKVLIIVITLAAVLIAGVFSFFIIPPTYEANAVLIASCINPRLNTLGSDQNVKELLDSISQYPQMTIETYKEQIKNPVIMEQTIEELGLEAYGINRSSLGNMISLNIIKDTNLITISVKNKDKLLTEKIANTVADKFISHISEVTKAQASKSSTYIKSQLEIEKKNLDDALVEYKEYLSQSQSLKELSSEVTSKINLTTKYKERLIAIEVLEAKLTASIETAKSEIDKTGDRIVLRKSILDDPVLNHYLESKSQSDMSTVVFESEEINENYVKLEALLNDLEIELADINMEKESLIRVLSALDVELERLQIELAEKEYQDKDIRQRLDFAQSTYGSFLKKYEEIRIIQSSDVGEASILLVSPAVEPLKPVSPNKKTTLAISAVLGLMVAVFIAFFIEYWKMSGKEKLEKVDIVEKA